MSHNYSSNVESVSADRTRSRRSVLRRAALCTSAALLGTAGPASAHDLDREIIVKSRGSPVRYRIEVSEAIASGPNTEADDEVRDEIVVVGRGFDGDLDDYPFAGEILDFEVLEGHVWVWVDGERVDPDDLGEDPEREISVHAKGPHVDYEFVVDGEVRPGEDADIGIGDEIDGAVVTGNVAGNGVDNYLYTGEIPKLHVTSDDVGVRLDGERVDPAAAGAWNFVSIHAAGPHVDYEVAVDGELDPASEADIGIGDEIDGAVATGNVAGSGVDSYWYTGEITSLTVSRDAVTLRVNGEEVDAADF